MIHHLSVISNTMCVGMSINLGIQVVCRPPWHQHHPTGHHTLSPNDQTNRSPHDLHTDLSHQQASHCSRYTDHLKRHILMMSQDHCTKKCYDCVATCLSALIHHILTSNSCILMMAAVFIANASMGAVDKALFTATAANVIKENGTITLAKVSSHKRSNIYGRNIDLNTQVLF